MKPIPSLILLLTLTAPGSARADIDLAFLLDTTGSMSGELREAKERVKQLADALTKTRPNERIRIGVVAYRDRSDQYRTKVSPLSDDVHVSFQFLAGLNANGGGDAPEDVLAGLHAAIHNLDWDQTETTERQIFLIGDAPPHLDYRDSPKPERLFREAQDRRITINAIGCRSLSKSGIAFFRRTAYATEGRYQHIGRMRADDTGLADAMLDTLTQRDQREEPGEPVSIQLLKSEPSVDHALEIMPWGDDRETHKTTCAVRITLPEGAGLLAEPRVAAATDRVNIELVVGPGDGSTLIYGFDRCLPGSTPIHTTLSFGG